MNTKIADVLDRARELIPDPQHWCKGRNHTPSAQSYCIRGAIARAVTGDAYGNSRFVQVVYDYLRGFIPPTTWGLAHFNDTAASWADIDALLAKAAREARAA